MGRKVSEVFEAFLRDNDRKIAEGKDRNIQIEKMKMQKNQMDEQSAMNKFNNAFKTMQAAKQEERYNTGLERQDQAIERSQQYRSEDRENQLADMKTRRGYQIADREDKQAADLEKAKITAAAKPKGPKINEVKGVRKDYQAQADKTENMKNFYNVVKAAKDDPNSGGKAIGAVYGFMKAIDDGSVVRPSELELAGETASTISSLKNKVVRLTEDGKPVPKEVIGQLMPAMEEYYKAALKRQQAYDDSTRKFIGAYNIPEEQVINNANFRDDYQLLSPANPNAASELDAINKELAEIAEMEKNLGN